MRFNHDVNILDFINTEVQTEFQDSRDTLRTSAKQQILKVRNENRKTYNLRRKKPTEFQLNDLVAIKRIRFGPGLKLKQNILGRTR